MPEPTTDPVLPYVICIPAYNDWESVSVLVSQIDKRLSERGTTARVLIVDDASIEPEGADFFSERSGAVQELEVLRLSTNLGHQRAIAIGLCHIHAKIPCRGIIVMDGDGEDTPEGLVQLLDEYESHDGDRAVFAGRARRTEGRLFKISYLAFRAVHRLLIGSFTRVGNFSVIPPQHLDQLVVMSNLWNHYAAAVYKGRLKRTSIPIDRGERIAGRSKMNYVSLVAHGLSAISVYGETIGTRSLLATGLLAALAAAGMVTVVVIRLGTDHAIPGWATGAFTAFMIVVLQAFQASLLFAFSVLQSRGGGRFLPIRDYSWYVKEVRSKLSDE